MANWKRWVLPAVGQASGDIDRGLLKVLAGRYRIKVRHCGSPACFGGYASVLQPGRITVDG